MRYNFDLVDTYTISHIRGAILDNDQRARAVGQEMAQRLRDECPELLGMDYCVIIRTESDDELARFSIDCLTRRTYGG